MSTGNEDVAAAAAPKSMLLRFVQDEYASGTRMENRSDLGRVVVSTQDFNVGDFIIREDPILVSAQLNRKQAGLMGLNLASACECVAAKCTRKICTERHPPNYGITQIVFFASQDLMEARRWEPQAAEQVRAYGCSINTCIRKDV